MDSSMLIILPRCSRPGKYPTFRNLASSYPFALLVHELTADSTHRRLDERSGLQTYISCAFSGSSLVVTSYINPEIYQGGRFAL